MAIDFDGLTPLLQVADMGVSLRFYCGAIGFEVVSAVPADGTPEWAMLARGEVVLMLSAADAGPHGAAVADLGRRRWHGDVALYFGGVDPEEAYDALLGAGVVVEPPREGSHGMKQLWLSDPDGYALCFQAPIS